MTVDLILPLIIIFIVPLLMGVLISLIVLLPPLRKRGQHSARARLGEICILGLITFAISFGGLTRLMAEADYLTPVVFNGTLPGIRPPNPDSIPLSEWYQDYQLNQPAVIGEMWVRLLIPPLLPCYSSQANICKLVDAAYSTGWIHGWDWQGYLLDIGFGVLSVLANSVGVWLFTRQHRSEIKAA